MTFSSALQQESEETVVLAQLSDELPSDFADRVLHRVATSALSGRHFDAAILFTGGPVAHDRTTCSARRSIALGVAAHAEASDALQELLVVAPADSDPDLREQLLGLADDLVLAGGDKPLRVRVRFQNDEFLPDPPRHHVAPNVPQPAPQLPQVLRTAEGPDGSPPKHADQLLRRHRPAHQ
jgi:hypothetical protein